MTLHFSDINNQDAVTRSFQAKQRDFSDERSFYLNVTKRVFDILVVLLFAPIVVPIILLMAVIVAFDGRNPFYSQLRVGKDGKSFRIWKIRTMVSDADQTLERHLEENPDARAEWDLHQKLKDDPRITRVGRLIRKSSLDELPQLANVLSGSMSLVGPRPMMVCQSALYHGAAYYKLQPGITGLWQISDRNEVSFAERARYDDIYGRTVSLRTDIITLWRTIFVVFRGTGY